MNNKDLIKPIEFFNLLYFPIIMGITIAIICDFSLIAGIGVLAGLITFLIILEIRKWGI